MLRDPPDPADTEIRRLWISTPHCARRVVAISKCRTPNDVLAVRKATDAKGRELRHEIRKRDTERSAIRGDSATANRRRVRLTNEIIRLRAELCDLGFPAPISANLGAGGRPPSHASVTFELAMVLAESVDCSDTRGAKILRMIYAHLEDTPERERFIRAEINRFNAWRARKTDRPATPLVRSTRGLAVIVEDVRDRSALGPRRAARL